MHEDKVNNYVQRYKESGWSTDPLEFYTYTPQGIVDLKEIDPNEIRQHKLGWLILQVLDMSRSLASVNSVTGEKETSPGCWRTSMDIWRHVIKYKRGVSLFRVMRYLYSNREHMAGDVCSRIRKMVFKLRKNTAYWMEVSSKNQDEYGMSFEDWKDVGQKGGK